MAAPKRPGGNAGLGRPRGSPNKITADIRGMILGALTAKGGQKYLELQEDNHPQAFMALLAKVLPTQITGKDDGPMHVDLTVGQRQAAALAILETAFGEAAPTEPDSKAYVANHQ